MKLTKDYSIDEINLMIADEMENLADTEMKVMMKERNIITKRLWNDLVGFEINPLQLKINTEIEILKNEEKKVRNIIDCLKKSKAQLLDLFTDLYLEYRYRSVKRLEKNLEKMKKN